jgi:hypothetical protein
VIPSFISLPPSKEVHAYESSSLVAAAGTRDPTSYSPAVVFLTFSPSGTQNYTQNIDTLETLAGVERVLQCHGSFARASCVQCKRSVPGKEIEREIMRGEVPLCTMCNVPTPRDGRGRDRKGKNLKRGKKSGWDSEEEDSESDDEPAFPPGIMKVRSDELWIPARDSLG